MLMDGLAYEVIPFMVLKHQNLKILNFDSSR